MKDNLKDIGILGRRHYNYLKANKPTVINVMRMNGTLNNYLKSVNEQAEEILFQLVKQMAKAEGITEQFKAADQLKWVGLMNNIRDRANEMNSVSETAAFKFGFNIATKLLIDNTEY